MKHAARAGHQDLLPGRPGRRRFSNHLKDLLEELRDLLPSAVYALAELTPRTRDAIAADRRAAVERAGGRGARASRGLRAETIDARTVILTDDAFGAASPLLAEIAPA